MLTVIPLLTLLDRWSSLQSVMLPFPDDGTQRIEIPCGEEVLNTLWEGEQLWYVVHPAGTDWQPEWRRFTEYSSHGFIERQVFLIERTCN